MRLSTSSSSGKTPSTKVWRRFRTVTLFLILVICGDRLIAFTLGRIVGKTKSRYALLYSGQAKADVLVIGNSRGVSAFYTPTLSKNLNAKVINLSENGLSIALVRALLLDYLDNNSTPRLIVIEISNLISGEDAVKNFRMFYKSSARIRKLGKQYDSTGFLASRLIHLYSFNNALFWRTLAYRNGDQGWISHGVFSKTKELEIESLEFALPTEEQGETLKLLLKELAQMKIETRLVISPYPHAYRNHIENWSDWFAGLKNSAGDKPIYDYSMALPLNTDFSDKLHNNKQGSEKFGEILIQDGIIF